MKISLDTIAPGTLKSYIRNTKNFNRTSFCAMITLLGLLSLLFFPLVDKIDNTEAIPVQSETTLALSTSDINMAFSADNPNGTFSSSDPANIVVNTNNYNGYTLNIATTTNDDTYDKLINTDNNEYYLNSISSASTETEFNIGNWGYLPSKLNGETNTKYQPAPNLDGTILDVTDAANNEDNTYSIALGIKIGYSTQLGTYANSFTITAVANPVGYTITYDKNTEEEVENMPTEQIGDVGATDVAVPNIIPARTDHKFMGWCDTTPTTNNGLDTCEGINTTIYQPNNIIDLSQTTKNKITLYAMWKKITINDLTYLQDFASLSMNGLGFVADSMPTNDAYTLIDNRDNTAYHIAKLVDGRIWFLDNLVLDLTDATVQSNLTPATTNATTTSINSLLNGDRASGDQYATAGVSSNWTSSTGNSYSAPLINMDSKDVVPDNAPTDGKGNNKVGGYYNFCAASAGSYCYGNDANEGTSIDNATEDICPAGWRMPTGSIDGEYQALATAIVGTTGNITDATAMANYRNALSLPLSGNFKDGLADGQGNDHGYFWSNTRSANNRMRSLNVFSSKIGPNNTDPRESGLSIRCITKSSAITITYNANGGTGEMADQTLPDVGGILNPDAFTRDGYFFNGWNTKADGSGTTYANKASYLGPSITLYAQWMHDDFEPAFANFDKTKITIGIEQYYKMQDMRTADICNAVDNSSANQYTRLVDIRDNQIYTVGKLADNKCWFLDNLAIDLTDAAVQSNLTPATTNASTASISALLNGSRASGDQYATAGVSSNWAGSYSFSVPLINMTNKDVIPSNAPLSSKGNNKVGGYYNYCAASAGSYCYGDGTIQGASTGNATEDICPAGWRMPTGNTTGEYSALANIVYGSTGKIEDSTATTNYRNVLSLPLAGYFYNGSAYSQGSYGYFWTSTRDSDYRMHDLDIYKSYIYPSDINRRIDGLSVRCIAKSPDAIISYDANGGTGRMTNQSITYDGYNNTLNANTFTRDGYQFAGWNTKADGSGTPYSNSATYSGPSTTLYAQWTPIAFGTVFANAGKSKVTVGSNQYYKMQDISTTICNAVGQNQSGQLVDTRDNTIYNVSKLPDGKCWMTSNLNLAGGTTLTPEKSNVTSNYTLPASSTAGFDDNTKAFVYNNSTYGGYYSYVAVTAGTSPSSGNAPSDICPKGWRLPTMDEYKTLIATYTTGATLTAAPWYGTYGGYLNGSAHNVGSGGNYWSSTAYTSFGAYGLGFDSSSAIILGNNKYSGYSARCISQ